MPCLCLVLVCAPLTAWGASPRGPGAADQAVGKKLTAALISGTLAEAIQRVQEVSGTKVVVDWRALLSCGVKPRQPIRVKTSGATVGQALDLILTQASEKHKPLAWYAEGRTIHVTSQRGALDRRLRLRPLPPRGAAATASSGAKASAGVDTSAPASSGGLDFEDVPFKDVIEYLRQRSGLSFHVNWRALAISGIDRETAIELKARNVTLARTLDLLTDQLSATRDRETSVYWIVENGVVSISTGAALNTGTRIRVIDVADILLIVPNFKGPRINFEQQDQNQSGRDGGGGGGGGGLFDEDRGGGAGGRDDDDVEENRKEMRERTRNALIKVVKHSIGEEMWTPMGKGNVQFLGSKLIISQTKLGFLLLKKAGILH